MRKPFTDIVKPFMPGIVINFIKRHLNQRSLRQWEKDGYPSPPPHIIKQNTIQDYQQFYRCETLIETGTFKGAMVEAHKRRFKKVISVELSPELHNLAVKRFRKDKNVLIIQGDSGKVLPEILKNIEGPIIFWLDGHYSAGITAKGDKDCPIFEEVDAILNSAESNHILLIDDARCFNGEGDYPTIDELTQYIRNKNDKYKVEVKNDIIRFVIS